MDSHKVDCVWPLNLDQRPRHKELIQHLASSCDTRTYLTSEISCMKLLRKSSLPADAMSKQIMYPFEHFAFLMDIHVIYLLEMLLVLVHAFQIAQHISFVPYGKSFLKGTLDDEC